MVGAVQVCEFLPHEELPRLHSAHNAGGQGARLGHDCSGRPDLNPASCLRVLQVPQWSAWRPHLTQDPPSRFVSPPITEKACLSSYLCPGSCFTASLPTFMGMQAHTRLMLLRLRGLSLQVDWQRLLSSTLPSA